MKKPAKKTLLTVLITCIAIVALFFIFDIGVSVPSSDIEYSPGLTKAKIKTDSIAEKPKNIIVFISDGMGFAHLSLAMMSSQKEDETSVWEDFDVKGWHDPRSSYGPLTDSAASASAMATGTQTFFGVIGQDPDENNITNVFEIATANQYNTGIVTDSYIWDATPAAFVAHTRSRDHAKEILSQYSTSELDLLFGELEDVGEGEVPDLETTMSILKQRFEILDNSLSLPSTDSEIKPIAAIYKEDEIQDLSSTPNLTKLTDTAIQYLSSQDEPFILLVECEELDSASHRNQSGRVQRGIESIEETLAHILEFSEKDGETMVLFTSDHETGGLSVVAENDYPDMQLVWSTKHHTASFVPYFVKGPGARSFIGVDQNWEIGRILKKLVSAN